MQKHRPGRQHTLALPSAMPGLPSLTQPISRLARLAHLAGFRSSWPGPVVTALALAIAGGVGGGCAATPDLTAAELAAPLSADQYPRAFDAARDTLRTEGFNLDRVDARAGIITTQRSSQVWEATDIIQRRQRYAIVRFTPASEPPSAAETTEDLRDYAGPLAMNVEVILERVEVPGWRIGSPSVRLATRTSDPERAQAGLEPLYPVKVRTEPEIADHLRRQIAEAMLRTANANGES